MKRALALLLMGFMLLDVCAAAETIIYEDLAVDAQATVVDFGTKRIRDVEGLCAFLDQLPCLEQADMYHARLSAADMEMLFTRYPDVFFGWTVKIADHEVRTDATAFSTLHTGNPKPPHESEDFEALKYCKNLLAIDIGHNWVQDIGFLRHFPNLKVLILACNKIEDISVLAQLTQLEYLELFTNKIRDYTPLSGLQNLRDLNIKNNPCKDLAPLHELVGLERLWAGCYVKLTKETMRAMEAAVPDCKINWRHMPTDGGWREHERYFVIRDMFRSGVYIPFEDDKGRQGTDP